ncbi:MAG TPA: GntR family transcriptional regulator [Chthoniobacteraceae bacterium]|jgi:DNA-binding GntR family transcriptional regulator
MVGDDVLDALRAAVMDGTFAPGERLAEAALARELRVSRAPVREAMLRLERDGLLAFDPRGTARVTEFGVADLEEIYSLRLALEPVAASRVAERGGEETFLALARNIQATSETQTLAEVSHLDAAFHEAIIQASGHRRLIQCWSGLGHQVLLWLTQMQREHQTLSHRTRDETVVAHRDVLEALRSGKASNAFEAMHRHIIGWREWLPLPAAS